MDLQEFVPALERIFSRPAFWADPSSLKAGAVTGEEALDGACADL